MCWTKIHSLPKGYCGFLGQLLPKGVQVSDVTYRYGLPNISMHANECKAGIAGLQLNKDKSLPQLIYFLELLRHNEILVATNSII